MNKYKLLDGLMHVVAVISFVLFVQSVAIMGAVNYTDMYEVCYEKDASMKKNGVSAEVAKAEFDYMLMNITASERFSDSYMVTMTTTSHTNWVLGIVRKVYGFARIYSWWGLAICVLMWLYWHKRRRYTYFKYSAIGSLIAPVVVTVVLFCFKFKALIRGLGCIFAGNYEALFADDKAVVSILPERLLLWYFLAYVGIWLIGSVAYLGAFYLKKARRRPHAF